MVAFLEGHHGSTSPRVMVKKDMLEQLAFVGQHLTAVRTQRLLGQLVKKLQPMVSVMKLQGVLVQSTATDKRLVAVLALPEDLSLVNWYSDNLIHCFINIFLKGKGSGHITAGPPTVSMFQADMS